MADEVLYASAGNELNKRKYEESPSPVARRATGFSSAPDSGAPPPSYGSAPPPMNEIELAKQKAQEIAARLLSNADPSKRARVENGGNGGGGYDSSYYEKPLGSAYSGSAQVVSSGGYGPSKKIEIPNGRVGVIIGKGGETIKYLQQQSGAKIQVTRDMDADPTSGKREVDLTGTPDQIARAERLIHDVLSEAEAGGSGSVSRRVTGQQPGADQFVMKIPNNRVGLVIGKGGETIKSMQATTGARIQVIPLHLPPGDTSQERTVQIDGSSEQIEAAKQLVEEVISENRMRNSNASGGYPQQGYQARLPSNWSQPSPTVQQPGYGYTQSGAYPGQPPQYNTNQPAYSGYPPQTATGGYTAGWDPSSAAAQQAGSYGYYNQGQGYGQDGYGGYYAGAAQSSYTQPQQNPTAGYDQQQQQQQQGYNSTYGNVSNPTPDASAASYGTPVEAHQAPTPNPSYPPQASNQPGYGAQTAPGYGPPPAQKPPTGPSAYAQPQQSPSAQGGGYAQPGYPPSAQAGYAQSGYPTAQAGYGYGAPPATQPAYGQQQPASYNNAYGGATNAQGTYDAAAPPQSGKPGGSAEASPPS